MRSQDIKEEFFPGSAGTEVKITGARERKIHNKLKKKTQRLCQ